MTTHPSSRQLDALSIAQSIELRLRQIVNGEWSDSRTDGEYADMARTLRDINDRLYGRGEYAAENVARVKGADR